MQVIACSIGKTSEPWDDPSALHCPVSKDWVFNANYAAKPVVHSQPPPTSDLIPSTHVLQFDNNSSDLQMICNFKHLFISDLSPSIIFDNMYVHSIT